MSSDDDDADDDGVGDDNASLNASYCFFIIYFLKLIIMS